MSNCTTASLPFCTVTDLCRLLICKLLCIKVSVRCPEDKCYLLRAQRKVSTPTAARLCPGTLRNFARLLITIDCPAVRSDHLKSNQDHTVTFNPACCLCSCVAQLGIPKENSQIDPGRFFLHRRNRPDCLQQCSSVSLHHPSIDFAGRLRSDTFPLTAGAAGLSRGIVTMLKRCTCHRAAP